MTDPISRCEISSCCHLITLVAAEVVEQDAVLDPEGKKKKAEENNDHAAPHLAMRNRESCDEMELATADSVDQRWIEAKIFYLDDTT